ncbi:MULTISPECIES: YihY/virulence factor BrkB family protein [Halorussus]|uniref:YihY/virulence factor BrkB family protein n=1 Tax=Halorussus TaxID=1070314 RepID=UPI00209FC35E|nr:YihY/virulence factor BrkB family protein [Halorussus vallis]USZ73916.1 YihY/virulence factor BrkB family protein [Halorussus vallis]
MELRSHDARAFVRAVLREVRAENVTFMAGSIAYHAFVSLIPLLLFALFVLSLVDNATLTESIVSVTQSMLAPETQGLLIEALADVPTRAGASLVGAAAFLWGTFKIFRGLDVAFSEIYDTAKENSLREQLRDGAVVLFALVLAVGVVVAAAAAFALVPNLPLAGLLNPLLLVAGLILAFFPVYYVFPDVDLTPREVAPGLLFATVGWAVLQWLFQIYVVYAGRYEAYGVVGGVLVLVTWLYLSALVLLLGAVVNAVLGGRTGDANALGGRVAAAERERFEAEHRESRSRTVEHRATEHRGSGLRAVERRESESDRQRSREDTAHLEAENERLRRENAALKRRLRRRRLPVWERVRRWMFGE